MVDHKRCDRNRVRFPARVLALVLAVFVIAGELPAQPTITQWLSTPEESAERLADGRNIQAIVSILSAKEEDGDLLDPNSVVVEFDGKEADRLVYYKKSDLALVFVLPPDDVEPPAELSLSMKTINGDDIDAPSLKIDSTENPSASSDDTITTRSIHVQDTTGNPISGAFYFGQRHRDLYTRSNEDGAVILDAPFRHTAGAHYLWAPGYWSEQFDPVTSSTITLARKDPEHTRDVPIQLVDSDGETIDEAVILYDSHVYSIYRSGQEGQIAIRDAAETEVFIMTAGRATKRVLIEPGQDELTVHFDD